MQMHSHFAGTAGNHIASELDIFCIHRHFIVGEVHRLKAIFLTQRLKARQKARVIGRNAIVVLPQIVAFGINGDEKCRFGHKYRA
ncbi:hypothetical protein D3C87_1970310 [compost metagenome]